MTARNNYIDNVKGALIFLVVFGHLIASSIGYSTILKTLYTFIYSFHVPLFVFVSGYLSKNYKKNRDLAIRNFLGLYLFSVMGYTFFSDILSFAFSIDSTMGIAFLAGKFVFILKDTVLSIFFATGPAWYLLSLIAWRLITPHLMKKRFLIISLFLAIIAGGIPWIGYAMSLSRIIVFYPYYLLGFLLDKDVFNKYTLNINKLFKPIAVISLFGIFYLISQININNQMLYSFSSYAACGYTFIKGALIRCFIYILAVIISVCFLWLITPKNNILSAWGKGSLNVYIWHIFLIPVVAILEKKLSLQIWFAPIALFISIGACAAFSGASFEKLTEKIKSVSNSLIIH